MMVVFSLEFFNVLLGNIDFLTMSNEIRSPYIMVFNFQKNK